MRRTLSVLKQQGVFTFHDGLQSTSAHVNHRIALYLLKDNPIEVLRRLAVICLEDAVLPPAYPALVRACRAGFRGLTVLSHWEPSPSPAEQAR